MLTQVESYTILPAMTRATKAIKITEQTHYQLRIMAAKSGKPIWELVDQAVVLLGRRGVAKNGSKAKERK